MNRKLLITRLEIIFAVVLIVIIAIGIVFFTFRAIPSFQNNPEELNGSPTAEQIRFLDITDQKEFSIASKRVILPENGLVLAAYNNTSSSGFTCQTELSDDCTIYDISIDGRLFHMSAPLVLKLKDVTSVSEIKKTLVVAGEEVEFTYTQRKYVRPTLDDEGVVEIIEQLPELTNIEEIYGCLKSGICFNSGRLTDDKATNDIDVTAFEKFVQSVVIQ